MKLAGGYADLTSTRPPLLASQNSVLQLHDIPALLLILAQVRGGASGGGNDGGGHDRGVLTNPLRILSRWSARRRKTNLAIILALLMSIGGVVILGPVAVVAARLNLALWDGESPERLRRAVDAAAKLPVRLRPRSEKRARTKLYNLGGTIVLRAIASNDLETLRAAAEVADIAYFPRRRVDNEINALIIKMNEEAAALKAMAAMASGMFIMPVQE